MSYIKGEPCGMKWIDLDGKEHVCRFNEMGPNGEPLLHICECSCDAQKVRSQMRHSPSKRPPLKLAKWKRGKKVIA